MSTPTGQPAPDAPKPHSSTAWWRAMAHEVGDVRTRCLLGLAATELDVLWDLAQRNAILFAELGAPKPGEHLVMVRARFEAAHQKASAALAEAGAGEEWKDGTELKP